jgi:hypothetical protein
MTTEAFVSLKLTTLELPAFIVRDQFCQTAMIEYLR